MTKLVKFMNNIVMGMHHLSGLGLVHRVSQQCDLSEAPKVRSAPAIANTKVSEKP